METARWEIDCMQCRIEIRHGFNATIHEGAVNLAHVAEITDGQIPAVLLDLADVAVAAYHADRLCRRVSVSQWTRRLDLCIGVRQPDLWSQPHVAGAIAEALGFYTGDEWGFTFVPVPYRQPVYSQVDLFPGQRFSPTRAALFSGGLDSLAGACRELVDSSDERLLLVSGSTSPRLRHLQRTLSFEISSHFHGRVLPSVIKFGFRNRMRRADRQDESTQRARGFVFCALGAVAALSAGLRELSIYENGVGSVNLPFTTRQAGVHLTRATNPIGLEKMEAVIKAVTGQPFRFRLPHLFTTKGVLCNSIKEAGLTHLVAQTVSCDGFPQRVAQLSQCGLCTSCLLRRVSLLAAGLGCYDARNYRVDVLNSGWYAPDHKLLPFRAMLYQAELLSTAVHSTAPWRALVMQFPELLEIAFSEHVGDAPFARGRLLDLYRSYCAEWERFPARPSGYEAALAA